MKNRRKSLTLRRRGSLFRKIKSALGWLLLLFALAVGLVACIIYRRADSEITRVVSRTLARQFPQSRVAFDSVRLDATRGLRLYNVKWSDPNAPAGGDPLLRADEIYVECPLELKKLVSGQFELRRIVVNHPTLSANGDLNSLISQFQTLVPANSGVPSPNLSVEINDADLVLDGTTISEIRVKVTPDSLGAGTQEQTREQEQNKDLYQLPTPRGPEDDAFTAVHDTSDDSTLSHSVQAPRAYAAFYAPEERNADDARDVADAGYQIHADSADSNVGFASYQPAFNDYDPAPILSDTRRELLADENTLAELTLHDADAEPAVGPEPHDSGYWNVEISVSNPFVENLEASGKFSVDNWYVDGSVVNLDLATLMPLVRRFAPEKLSLLAGVQGKTSLRFSLSSADGSLANLKTRVDGELVGAAVSSSVLKYPVSEIDAGYTFENNLFEIRRFVARCGQTALKAAFRQLGSFTNPGDAEVRVQLETLPLTDAELVSVLNAAKSLAGSGTVDALLNFLDDYRFSGVGNFDLALENIVDDGKGWRLRNLSVDGRNVEFLCTEFPYRLDGLAGTIGIDADGAFSLLLESQKAAFPVKVQGRFVNVFTHPRGQVDVLVQNRAIDAQVFQAINEESREALEKLHPSGFANARVRIGYNPDRLPASDRLSVEARIDVRDATIQYEPFPMPVSSISGALYLRNGTWALTNITGKSGGAAFAAAGSLVSGAGYAALGRAFNAANSGGDVNAPDPVAADPSVAAAMPLLMEPSPAPIESFTAIPAVAGAPLADDSWRFLIATNVRKFPLGEELREAILDDAQREALEKIRLEGKADGQIRVGYRTDEKRVALQFDASPIPGSASFTPEGFPFPLSDVEGQVSWREGKLTISGLRARNGNTTLSANVTSQTIPNVGTVLDVAQLRVDQLQIDRDLKGVTTVAGQEFINFLQPSGFFNIDGAIRVTRAAAPGSRSKFAWNLRLVAQQNSARPGTPIAAICGRVRTYGVAMEDAPPLVFGEFDIDSFFYKDAQVTNLVGPFYYNGANVFWGTRAPNIRRTPLYLDSFIRQNIDADPLYQTARQNLGIIRGQNADVAGFGAPDDADQTADANASPLMSTTRQEPAASEFNDPGGEEGSRSIQARLFGGQAVCDGVFVGGTVPRYRFTTSLQNAELDEAIRVFAPGSKPLKGVVGVNATLQGEGRNIAALKGEGTVAVREAQLYELPQIVKILQILSVQEPGENAFSACDVDFKVLGDHLQLSHVLLEGDALTLFGDGWLTIRQQEQLIDLTLSSRLGNSRSQIPIVSDVLGAAGDQVAQIRVEGNLSSPVIQQDRLPGLKKAWWSIFPEQEPTPDGKTPVERSRPVRDAWRKLIGTETKED